jgi:ring-1,2-phenylacetyl-CoA epoxidase subunit PaaB
MAGARQYEVFRREHDGKPLEHAGSLEAPADDLAVLYARQIYGRRNDADTLWIVPREAVIASPVPEAAFDKSYRVVAGYSIKGKLAQARAAAGTERERRG